MKKDKTIQSSEGGDRELLLHFYRDNTVGLVIRGQYHALKGYQECIDIVVDIDELKRILILGGVE